MRDLELSINDLQKELVIYYTLILVNDHQGSLALKKIDYLWNLSVLSLENSDECTPLIPSHVVSLRIWMDFPGFFNLASGGFLAVPPPMCSCSNLLFETQVMEAGVLPTRNRWTKGPPCSGVTWAPLSFTVRPFCSLQALKRMPAHIGDSSLLHSFQRFTC